MLDHNTLDSCRTKLCTLACCDAAAAEQNSALYSVINIVFYIGRICCGIFEIRIYRLTCANRPTEHRVILDDIADITTYCS